MPGIFVILVAAALLTFTGCAPRIQKPVRVCPGREFTAEALSILRSRSQNTVPLRANGQCRLQYYVEGKLHKENFPVKLWFSPAGYVRLQGDVAFDPKGIVLGSNEREFWLAIKLKEVSSYWWGKWSELSCPEKLMISPEVVLEALGIAAVGSDEGSENNWLLSSEGAFDVLTRRDEQGVIIKKVYVSNCDYLAKKIEYFEAGGQAVVVTELDKYKQVSEGFFVPAVIKIIKRPGSVDDSVSITLSLKSIKSADFTQKQQNRLFSRPEPRGFKHVYEITEDCDMIEQPQ